VEDKASLSEASPLVVKDEKLLFPEEVHKLILHRI
jgi:hypothetical protein